MEQGSDLVDSDRPDIDDPDLLDSAVFLCHFYGDLCSKIEIIMKLLLKFVEYFRYNFIPHSFVPWPDKKDPDNFYLIVSSRYGPK